MSVAISSDEGRGFPWWLVLIDGIALLVLGILFLISPAKTSAIAVFLLGAYWLVGGILRIVSIFIDNSSWGWKLFAGILAILAGIVVLQHPLWSTVIVGSTVVIILGIQAVIYGGIGIYLAIKGAGLGPGILAGISLLIGIALLFNVWVATFSLPWVIGILAIVGGISGIVAAFRLR